MHVILVYTNRNIEEKVGVFVTKSTRRKSYNVGEVVMETSTRKHSILLSHHCFTS
jgi:hypothetical protein